MSGRDPDAPIPADFRCDYAEPGERACPAWRCDCFVATHPDSPFDLHPEDFTTGPPRPFHRWRSNEDVDMLPGTPDRCLACGVLRYPRIDHDAARIAAGPCPKGKPEQPPA